MDIKLEYGLVSYSEISKLWTVYADISKEDVTKLFKHELKTPMNENREPDTSYTCGEIQFLFNDSNLSLNQVLVFPSYEDENGDITNGDFIDMTEYFYDEVSNARKVLNKNKTAQYFYDNPETFKKYVKPYTYSKALFTSRQPGYKKDTKAPRYSGKSTIDHLPKMDIKIKKDLYVDPDFRFTIFSNGMVASKINFNRMYLKKEDLEAMKELIDIVINEMK